MRRCGPFDCDCDRAGGCPDRSWCPSRRCREQCQRGSGPDGDVNRGWREYRWLGRSGRSIGRHRQHISRRKRWSQRRRRKRRAVGRWGESPRPRLAQQAPAAGCRQLVGVSPRPRLAQQAPAPPLPHAQRGAALLPRRPAVPRLAAFDNPSLCHRSSCLPVGAIAHRP